MYENAQMQSDLPSFKTFLERSKHIFISWPANITSKSTFLTAPEWMVLHPLTLGLEGSLVSTEQSG